MLLNSDCVCALIPAWLLNVPGGRRPVFFDNFTVLTAVVPRHVKHKRALPANKFSVGVHGRNSAPPCDALGPLTRPPATLPIGWGYVFSVAAAILAAVEGGILPPGKNARLFGGLQTSGRFGETPAATPLNTYGWGEGQGEGSSEILQT